MYFHYNAQAEDYLSRLPFKHQYLLLTIVLLAIQNHKI